MDRRNRETSQLKQHYLGASNYAKTIAGGGPARYCLSGASLAGQAFCLLLGNARVGNSFKDTNSKKESSGQCSEALGKDLSQLNTVKQ